jgi:hypothetical protein
MNEKPIAYAFSGPDGLHFVGLRPASEYLRVNYHTLRSTAVALCAGFAVGSDVAARLRAEFPNLCTPCRVEARA